MSGKRKKGGVAAEVDWGQVVTTLMERLLLTQKEFAETCRVAQQTVSAWKEGKRQPGRMAQRQLLMMAKGAGLAETMFPTSALDRWRVQEKRSGFLADSRDEDSTLREINVLLSGASAELRGEVLAYVRFRVLEG